MFGIDDIKEKRMTQQRNLTRASLLFILATLAACGGGGSDTGTGGGGNAGNGPQPLPSATYQFGTTSQDVARAIAMDAAGNYYVAGYTSGDMDGAGPGIESRGQDIFVTKFNSSGAVQWIRQLGASGETLDEARGIAVDGSGNVFVTGYTRSDLGGPGPGTPMINGVDAFLLKYDTNGNLLWVRQFSNNIRNMEAKDVATDAAGNAYVAGAVRGDLNIGAPSGYTSDLFRAFLVKYDVSGNVQWVRYLESINNINFFSGDGTFGTAVGVDRVGNVYLTGDTDGDIDGNGPGQEIRFLDDPFLAKFDASGNRLWVRQFGTTSAADFASDLAVDAFGNVYVVGATYGDMDGVGPGIYLGWTDAYVARFRGDGQLLGIRQVGTSEKEFPHGVAVDPYGNVFVTGSTEGAMDGPVRPNQVEDIFVIKYNPYGERVWTKQFGTDWVVRIQNGDDVGSGVTTDSAGNVYIAGHTAGDLDGSGPATWIGNRDPFVIRLGAEPSARIQPTPGPDIRQLATPASDAGYGIATDSAGNVLIAGVTSGDIDGPAGGSYQGGIGDVFLAKYGKDQTVTWIRQFGTSGNDAALAIATDSSENSYIAGYTRESIAGANTLIGLGDMFVAKIGSDGQREWIRQIGTPQEDAATAIATDIVGNTYMTGYTRGDMAGPTSALGDADIVLVKHNSAGSLLWTRQIGTTAYDIGYGVSTDAEGNAYITGVTNGDLDAAGEQTWSGGADLFVAKYNAAGLLLWIRQFGTSAADEARAITFDGSSVMVTGLTNGDLDGAGSQTHSGGSDLFTLKLDTNGNVQWIRQHGTIVDDESQGVSADGFGNVYITGVTYGDLDGGGAGTAAGGGDIFVVSYDPNGTLRWIRQRGSNQFDAGHAIAADAAGSVFLAGESFRTLTTAPPGPSAGLNDVVIMRYGAEQP